jgi:hypothetical protein
MMESKNREERIPFSSLLFRSCINIGPQFHNLTDISDFGLGEVPEWTWN